MDNYKAPKLKLKKRKMKPKAKKDSHYGEVSMDTSEEKAELADIPIKGKIRIKKKKKKKKSGEGEIKFRKAKGGPKEMTIIDARAATREAAKEALERGRLQQTKKLYKNIMKSFESTK